MKTNLNEKLITTQAYRIVCSRSAIAIKRHLYVHNFRKNLDFRTNHDKAVFQKIKNLINTLDFAEISEKQRTRAKNKYSAPVENYRNNKLTVDYFNNKNNIKFISENCISFYGGRNHYAKNSTDLKIISVLRKYFIK